MVRQAASFRKMVKQLPIEVTLLHGGEALDIGGRQWRVRIGQGHSPACACLWNPQERILIIGDHVLPSISPNINLLAVGPTDPLADYLASLRDFENLPCELPLPAHGVFVGSFQDRVRELQGHHERHLERLESFCDEPRTAFDCVPHLFNGTLPDHQMYFALGEAAAHLAHLAVRGRLQKSGDKPWHFSSPGRVFSDNIDDASAHSHG
jgi:glyoxylase-like metal-dependent hydrolase (beta-lactamase superfamily II)